MADESSFPESPEDIRAWAAANLRTRHIGIDFAEHPEFGLGVANVIALWNALELELAFILSECLAVSDAHASALLLTARRTNAKLAFVHAAGDQILTDHPMHAEFTDALKALTPLAQVRNRLAHAIYGVNDLGEVLTYSRLFQIGHPQWEQVLTVEELVAARERMQAAYRQLVALRETLRRHPSLQALRDASLRIRNERAYVRSQSRQDTNDHPPR